MSHQLGLWSILLVVSHPQAEHACGIRLDGRAYCWPILGGGSQTCYDQDKLSELLLGQLGTVRDVQAGSKHTCVLMTGDGGPVRCIGLNSDGQAPDPLPVPPGV